MNENSTHQTNNIYVPPPMHNNFSDLDSNSTQASQIDSDASRAQQGEQTGMASYSMPEQKPKKEYVFYYHQPGEEFGPPSQSQSNAQFTEGYVPTFPKKEGQWTDGYVPIFQKNQGSNPFESSRAIHPYQAEKFVSNGCNNCNRCAECSLRRDRELRKKNQEDGCECCVKWCICISCGLCIAAVGGDASEFSNIFEETKKEEYPNQNPYRM